MTLGTAPHLPNSAKQATATINYQVAMPHPENHLFEVTLHLVDYSSSALDLKMPVWTPGSYLVREYAKHLQDFSATSHNKALNWQKIGKNHWQVETNGASEVTIKYRIFANELTVRTNHLDPTHGYFNGAAIFFRIPEFDKQPIRVAVETPNPQWQVTTTLPVVEEQKNTFIAADFDTLVDSPFEIGTHQLHDFEVNGKPHQLAIYGKGNVKVEPLIEDIKKIVEVEADMFEGLPYERYLFLLHLSAQSFGGLEHKDSCSLIYRRFGFSDREKYERFMQLVAHEFFHLWNVKRIRPKELEVFDYDQENYTPSLWFCEGTTSYYDLLIPLRAGIYDVDSYLNNLSKEITRYLTTPGRKVQPVAESSFDAWIKLYRQDANSPNSQISYYLKGEMITLLLDLLIRSRHQNQRSLDDVMLKLWQKFGKDEIGYTAEELKQVIESVAGSDLTEFFERYVSGREELPFNEYLEPFGLKLVADKVDEPFLGIKVVSNNGKESVKFVEYDSPAQVAGIDAGDELLAIDGIKVTANKLSARLKDYQPQENIEITVFHQDELRTYSVTLAEPRANKYRVAPVENLSNPQKDNFNGFLGV
ncbi:putative protease with the C-terminal PDZ domain [Rivularia sp. PCC 7116]|uniref:M61 family metallopeptidase n=1 Tax=Rivularia sp. PCC 7116 TaxID=373994 RepID=UPI00029F3592|nr:M61 family metallopeptidase [Rivularia sp. PCC 7116]AFY57945.1 putative protease with the C-terminal PDZ domain [Rivularia sp. PCC 7116]